MAKQQQLGFISPTRAHVLDHFNLDGVYRTSWGGAVQADSLEVLRGLPDDSIDLVVTSPPLRPALQEGIRQRKPG